MATVEELKTALRDNLERSGTLPKIKAKIRADIFQALGDHDAMAKPELSNENLVINELIREYLVWNGYRETASVFGPETGQPQVRPFERAFLAQHLNLPDGPSSAQVPLLYGLVDTMQQVGERSREVSHQAAAQR